MNRIKMWDKNGNRINLDSYGLFGLALIPEAPSYSTIDESWEGMDGVIRLDKRLNPRNLSARFSVHSFDYTNSLVRRDETYSLLSGYDPFYIGESKIRGKRWLVESIDPWMPERYNARTQEVILNLIAYKGVAESTNTIERTYNTNEFTFKNEGNRPLNPRAQTDTEIIFRGASNNLKIRNKTTNETWEHNGNTNAGDTVLLKGVRSTRNSLSIFRNTNKRIITIAPGVNEFEVTGASDFEITIKTPFYFL